ncbi:hypothetical protein E3N88_31604 [Mikania micrantha]|uniref:Uncharacterized protein n=1 Tax=Mikania micrantha TaxID=192012 RepID=A0A5N6M608_9ASTR|nr:hypothetical protein E3N88_31604 [Mikania micrantha]
MLATSNQPPECCEDPQGISSGGEFSEIKQTTSLNTGKSSSREPSFWNTNSFIQNAIPSEPGSQTYHEWIHPLEFLRIIHFEVACKAAGGLY